MSDSWLPARLSPLTTLAGRLHALSKGSATPSPVQLSSPRRTSHGNTSSTPPAHVKNLLLQFAEEDEYEEGTGTPDQALPSPQLPHNADVLDCSLDEGLFADFQHAAANAPPLPSSRPGSAPPARIRQLRRAAGLAPTPIARSRSAGVVAPLGLAPTMCAPVGVQHTAESQAKRMCIDEANDEEEVRAWGRRGELDTSSSEVANITAFDFAGDFLGRRSGDGSPCLLPVLQSTSDIVYISADVCAGLLRNEFPSSVDRFLIVDCRFPYEFEGGHIKEALNIYEPEDIFSFFTRPDLTENTAIIFHCEFSSERAPRMFRTLRRLDRHEHADQYPRLRFPQMFVLAGGYKAFFETQRPLCTPEAYVPMNSDPRLSSFYMTPLKRAWKRAASIADLRSSASASASTSTTPAPALAPTTAPATAPASAVAAGLTTRPSPPVALPLMGVSDLGVPDLAPGARLSALVGSLQPS